MAIYNDFQQVFNCFSKLAIEGNYSLQDAINYCCERTTPQIAAQFRRECLETTNKTIQAIIAQVKNELKAGKDQNAILLHYKETTPLYIFNEILQALNLPQPAIELKADYKTLSKYIDCGFELYPCISKQDGDKIKYLPITLNGKIALYDTDEQKQAKDRHGINNKTILQDLCTQRRTITDEYGRTHKIELFRIYPLDNKYIVIDIDTHAGHANGLMQWQQYIKAHGLEGVDYYKNLDLFPCFVESANGGKHLYFKMPYDIPQKIINLATSVEISTKNHGETAAGSFRKGSKNNFYILHGDLNDAPILPLCIYKDMQPRTGRQPANTYKKGFAGNYNNGPKWNKTIDGIIEKARTKGATPHDFAYWICKYCKMANDNDGTQYGKTEIENTLFSLPELAQHDKNDTQGVINSFNF